MTTSTLIDIAVISLFVLVGWSIVALVAALALGRVFAALRDDRGNE